ncbi:hypothetical protein J4731_15500 [Providencia rettgeri]|nr:hypothetical protein [Providencia rettgeri]
MDFRDYILTVERKDVKSAYVSLEKEYKKKIQDFEAEYGSDNIHGLRRHGSGTTLEQQKYRSKLDILPMEYKVVQLIQHVLSIHKIS